jgi:hypothetical protein
MKFSTVTAMKLALAFLATASANRTPSVFDQYNDETNNAQINAVIAQWSSHPVSFIENLDGPRFDAILAKAMGAADVASWTANPAKYSQSKADALIRGLTDQDIKKMPLEVCQIANLFLESIQNPSSMSEDCRKDYYVKLGAGNVRPQTVSGIPSQWIKDDKDSVAKAFQKATDKTLTKRLKDETFKMMVSNDENGCAMATAASLHLLSQQAKKLQMIMPECFAVMQGLDSEELGKIVTSLPSNIFSKFDGELHAATLRKMTPAQAAAFAVKIESSSVCENSDFTQVSGAALAALRTDCVRGTLQKPRAFGKKISKIPTTVWSGLKENMDIVKNIAVEDFAFLSQESLQIIFDNEVGLENLPAIGPLSDNITGLKLTKDMMAALVEKAPEAAASLLFSTATLPDDILAKVPGKQVMGLKGYRGKSTLENIGLLNAALKTRSNFGKILSLISEEADEHVCATLDEDQYLKSVFRVKPSKKCIESLTFDTKSADFLAKAPEFAKNEDAWKSIVSAYKKSDWESIKPALMSNLVQNPEFCAALTEDEHKEIIAYLPAAALITMGDKCIHAMKSLVTAANAKSFSDDAFASFTAEEFTFALTDLTPAQVSFVSASLAEGDKKHVFATTITADILKALDNERLAAVSARQWNVMLPASAAVLTKDNIKLIKPKNMTRFTDAHLEAVSAEALIEMSDEQIAFVGKESKAKLTALDKVASKLEGSKAEALAARKANPPAADTPVEGATAEAGESSQAMWYWIIGGVLAVVIIAGVVFFVIRK